MQPYEKLDIDFVDYYALVPDIQTDSRGAADHSVVVFQTSTKDESRCRMVALDQHGKLLDRNTVIIDNARKQWRRFIKYGWIVDPNLKLHMPKYKTYFGNTAAEVERALAKTENINKLIDVINKIIIEKKIGINN